MQTLAELVERVGPLRVRDAIGWTLRAALSVWELHRSNRAHGRLSLEAIAIDLADCTSDGVLVWASRLENQPAFHSLERGADGKPSKEDDVWALGVILYFLLTGKHPYPEGAHGQVEDGDTLRPPTPIAVHNSDLDVMQPVVDRLLSHRDRATIIEEVVAGLQDFSPAIADLPPLMVEAPTTSMPPPATRLRDVGARGGADAPVDQRTRMVIAGLVAVGLVAIIAAFALRGGAKPTAPSTRPPLAPSAPAPTGTSPAPGTATPPAAVPTSTSGAGGRTEDLTACLSPYFSDDAFSRPVRRDFPCRELAAGKVDQVITLALSEGGGGIVTEAARDWSQLGWYRLAAMTLLRSRCCAQPPPLTTPPLLRTCELDPALAALAAAKNDDAIAVALEKYGEATRCAHTAGGGALLGIEGPPTKAQGALYIRMLTRARQRNLQK